MFTLQRDEIQKLWMLSLVRRESFCWHQLDEDLFACSICTFRWNIILIMGNCISSDKVVPLEHEVSTCISVGFVYDSPIMKLHRMWVHRMHVRPYMENKIFNVIHKCMYSSLCMHFSVNCLFQRWNEEQTKVKTEIKKINLSIIQNRSPSVPLPRSVRPPIPCFSLRSVYFCLDW